MLKKEHKKLHKSLSSLVQSLESIYSIIDEILQRPDMDLSIQIENKTFKFYPPTTQQEYENSAVSRDEFIKILLTQHTKTYINSSTDTVELENQFKDMFALVNVKDPKLYQVKKKYKYKVTEVPRDKDGNIIKSKPLNMGSSYVKNDLIGEHVKTN